MPGWLYVKRKPTPVGRESHTTADCDTGTIIVVEPYEGKVRMQEKNFCQSMELTLQKRCVASSVGSAPGVARSFTPVSPP